MSGRSNGSADTKRAFILGLDGIPWDRIQKWIEADELPNFKTVVDDGVCSPLQSTVPPTTSTSWPSIATGVWPDKHGIYGFRRVESNYTQRMNTSDEWAQPALWDLISPAVVGNVPMTFPASSIDGTMVSGMLSPEIDRRATHPAELSNEIDEQIPNYKVGLDWQDYSGSEKKFRNDLASLVRSRRDLMRKMMDFEGWRIFFFVYTAPDRLQHLIWDDAILLEHYKQLDDILGEVITYTNQRNANLFVVSDHGFGPISKTVNLNAILANEGYLTQKGRTAAQSSLASLGITKSTILESVRKLGIDDGHLVNALPKRIVDQLATRVPGDHELYDVDFSETVAFAHGPSHVYINDVDRFENGIVPSSDVESVKQELMALFSNVTDPETGERVLDVSDGDELFPTDDRSPDLVVVGRDGYEEKSKLSEEIFSDTGEKAASHRSEGIFLARGPGIAPRDMVEEPSVVDVAPTVLHSIGEPIPENTDGEVRTSITTGGDTPTVRSVRHGVDASNGEAETTDDFDSVEDRLKGLGYME